MVAARNEPLFCHVGRQSSASAFGSPECLPQTPSRMSSGTYKGCTDSTPSIYTHKCAPNQSKSISATRFLSQTDQRRDGTEVMCAVSHGPQGRHLCRPPIAVCCRTEERSPGGQSKVWVVTYLVDLVCTVYMPRVMRVQGGA